VFCSKCGKEIAGDGNFCASCGAVVAETKSTKTPTQPQGVNFTISRSLFTGFSAIVLIILLLQKMLSVPFITGRLGDWYFIESKWYSFYGLISAINKLIGVAGDSAGIYTILIASWFYFAFLMICVIILVGYLVGLVTKWSKAPQIGKIAFLLTAIFAIVVFVSSKLLHIVLSIEFAEVVRVPDLILNPTIQFNWVFYVMLIIAALGWILGFEKKGKV